MLDQELFDKIMARLQEIWVEDNEALSEFRKCQDGIRSSQIAALVELLIEKGIINEDRILYEHKDGLF